MFQGKRDNFYSLWNGKFYALGEGTFYFLGSGTFYPLGIWPSIVWDSGQYPGNGTRETGHGKRDTLSSGIRTTYPLGIGNLGDEVQPHISGIILYNPTKQLLLMYVYIIILAFQKQKICYFYKNVCHALLVFFLRIYKVNTNSYIQRYAIICE